MIVCCGISREGHKVSPRGMKGERQSKIIEFSRSVPRGSNKQVSGSWLRRNPPNVDANVLMAN